MLGYHHFVGRPHPKAADNHEGRSGIPFQLSQAMGWILMVYTVIYPYVGVTKT